MTPIRCCWYHKGTIFQANHNWGLRASMCSCVVVDTTKVQFFKQITTSLQLWVTLQVLLLIPQRYNFSSKSQLRRMNYFSIIVVVDTTKVQFFKQITTTQASVRQRDALLLIPQRYNFSSKSQHRIFLNSGSLSCCWYHKGTIFQANHNKRNVYWLLAHVVVDTTKVQFFKQITTTSAKSADHFMLLLIPQRYNFSSKSQRAAFALDKMLGCCWYHKGTIFQANHNYNLGAGSEKFVVVDTTKVQFFKQITTRLW